MLLTLSKASFIVRNIIKCVCQKEVLGEGEGGAVTRSGSVKLHAVFPTKTVKNDYLFLMLFCLHTRYVNECLNLLLEEIMITIIFYH